MFTPNFLKAAVLFLTPIFILGGCASVTDKDKTGLTPQGKSKTQEQIVGEQIHQQILASFYPYTDPKVVQYVNEVGRHLAAYAKRKNFEYVFTILYNEKIYATSAPGGYVYVTTGMINFLQTEAELAAVLAHEIGELQYADPRFSNKDEMIGAATQAGALIAPMFGPFGSLAGLGLALVQAYNESSHRTPEERLLESDRVALHYLLKAGYDPQALLDVQKHFLQAEKAMTPYFYDYYQSRPITEKRMAGLTEIFGKLPLSEKNLTTDAVEYQTMTQGIREIYKNAPHP